MDPILRRGLLCLSSRLAVALSTLGLLAAAAHLAAQPPSREHPVRVRVHRVTPEPLAERLLTTGTILANEHVELVSEVAGKVEAIHFEEGRRVEKGDLLVKIDDRELTAERARARHRLDLAERREARQRQLLDEGVISEQEYDVAASERGALAAELALIESRLEKTEIRAPFDGVVGLRRVSPGAYLSPQTAIATLQQVDPIKVDFTLPGKYARAVGLGHAVEFRVDGLGSTFRGIVYAAEPGVDPETRSLALRARCPNPDGSLLPGAFADVEVVVREVAAALTVPAIAVVPELGGRKVWVVEGGVAAQRSVTTGLRGEATVEITSGLAAGEQVVVGGLQELSTGATVEIVAEGGDEAP